MQSKNRKENRDFIRRRTQSTFVFTYFFFTEIANFLDDDECDHIINLAKKEGLEESKTLETGEDQKGKSYVN